MSSFAGSWATHHCWPELLQPIPNLSCHPWHQNITQRFVSLLNDFKRSNVPMSWVGRGSFWSTQKTRRTLPADLLMPTFRWKWMTYRQFVHWVSWWSCGSKDPTGWIAWPGSSVFPAFVEAKRRLDIVAARPLLQEQGWNSERRFCEGGWNAQGIASPLVIKRQHARQSISQTKKLHRHDQNSLQFSEHQPLPDKSLQSLRC